MSSHYLIPLEENKYYHIYNKGNAGVNIFYKDENYIYFLKKYDQYLSDYIETFAYCLMPNHFHLLVRLKDKMDCLPRKDFPSLEDLESLQMGEVVSELFRRFFMGYSKSVNIQECRTGSLFQKNFKRKLVDSNEYFTRVVAYIHRQCQHHGFTNFTDKDYPWSSYNRMLLDSKSKLMKKEVIDWFGGREHYVKFHKEQLSLNDIEHLLIED